MIAKHKLILLLAFLCAAIPAFTQETNKLSVSEKKMQRGSESSLTIEMDNLNEIVAVQFTLTVPDGFTINPSSAIIAGRGFDHMLTVRKIGDRQYKFAILSPTNTPLKGIKGPLAIVNIKANSSLEEDNDYNISVSEAVMSLKSGENVLDDVENGIIHIVSLPNLHVTALNCSEAVAGSEMTVSWTVRNDGKGSTGDIQWDDYIWLVPDIQGGTSMTGAKLLKTVSNVSALDNGESYNNTVNIPLEERIYGNFDVVVSTDMRSITNLDLSSFGNVLPRPYPIDSFIYASTDAQNNIIDEENETPTRSDNFRFEPVDIQIPPLADLQVPTVVVVVDNNESYTGENNVPSPLVASGLASSTAFYSGKKVKVVATIQNKGGAPTTPKNISNALFISHNANREDGLGFRLDSNNTDISLNPEETAEITFTGYIPYNWYGETYFHVQVDVNDAVYESANTANNWGKTGDVDVLMAPGADFKPTFIKVPAEVSHNSTLDISYSVSNIGPGVPFSSSWIDKFYISQSPDGLTNDAISIGKCSREGHFDIEYSGIPGASLKVAGGITGTPTYTYTYVGDDYNASQSISLPRNLSPGEYYIYVVIDANDDVFEYDGEDNNILCSSKVEVKDTDLSVSLSSISEENLITDDNVAIAWNVKNEGESDISSCTITDGIYASNSADGSNAILLHSAQNTISLAKGVSKTFRANVTIPKNSSLKGSMYVFVKTNIKNDVVESNTSNNKSNNIQRNFEYVNPEEVEKAKVNGTNLTVYSLQAPSETSVGDNIPVSFSIKNTGTEVIGNDVKLELFLCKSKSYNNSAVPLTIDEADLPETSNMQPEENKTWSGNVSLPANIIGGSYYIIAYANREKSMSEKTYNDNTQECPIYINGNLPDLAIIDLSVPDKINTGEDVDITWAVTNIGDWDAKATTLSIYLSEDNAISKNDKLLENMSISGLKKGSTLNQNAKIKIEDGTIGNRFIILAVNENNSIEEAGKTNNSEATQFVAVQSPVADLVITDFTIEGEMKAGQTVEVKANVKNTGDVATRKDKWADAFYLCSDYNFAKDKATLLGSKAHAGILQPGESYEISTNIKVPTDAQGYYVVYALADANNALFETNEANNSARTTAIITNSSTIPSDLLISKLSMPSSIKAGEEIEISYIVQNNSDNTANGMLRDVIYMSEDNKLDSDDQMVGVVSGEVEIEPGNYITREVTGRITNMVEGSYYLIVKTNSTHSIAESDYDNNHAVAGSTSTISYARLELGETVSADTYGLFKLNVHDGVSAKTFGVKLSHPEETPATLYAAYESVPTTASYDRKSNSIEEGQQELLIPDVKTGNYYILAQANSATNKSLNEFLLIDQSAGNEVPMILSTDEVKFGATSLSIKEGGNGGWISTDVRGALLDSIMDFRLVKGDKVIPIESLTFYNQTSTKSIFNLKDAETGQYDMVSELPDGTRSTLSNAFSVVPGTEVGLGVKIEGPRVVHMGSYAPISITYSNGGNTDVCIKEFVLVIDKGAVATSIEGLKNNQSELHFVPDTGIDSRGYASISPGTQKTINCFMQQGAATSHLTIYVIK